MSRVIIHIGDSCAIIPTADVRYVAMSTELSRRSPDNLEVTVTLTMAGLAETLQFDVGPITAAAAQRLRSDLCGIDLADPDATAEWRYFIKADKTHGWNREVRYY